MSDESLNAGLPSDVPTIRVPGSSPAIESLMDRYQQADEAAIRELIERVTPVLLRFFRFQGAKPEQAEDLVQDTWLRIHRVRHTYRLGEPLMPWIFAIARRARIDHFRRNLRASLHEVSSSVLPDVAAPVAGEATTSNLCGITDALPESQREVIVMLKVAGMSIEEVARATGSTVGAVKQKAHRAYLKLRQLLEPSSQDSPRRAGAE